MAANVPRNPAPFSATPSVPIKNASNLSDARFSRITKVGRGALRVFDRPVWRKPLALAADAAMPDLWVFYHIKMSQSREE